MSQFVLGLVKRLQELRAWCALHETLGLVTAVEKEEDSVAVTGCFHHRGLSFYNVETTLPLLEESKYTSTHS